jgi:hypothetical protein
MYANVPKLPNVPTGCQIFEVDKFDVAPPGCFSNWPGEGEGCLDLYNRSDISEPMS